VKRAVVFAMLMGVSIPRLKAAVHPAVDPNVNAGKCVQCHADKTKSKFPHPPVPKSCMSCHEVRVNRDITRVKLITATPLSLCLSCHTDKKASEIKGKVHSPNVRDCLKCHDPHGTDNKNQLLLPVAGATKQENLCLTCHNMGVDIPKGGSRHPALDSGCDACHVIHLSGDPTQRQFAYHLTGDAPALCLTCHDVKDAAMVKAHQNQPIDTADCLQCHDPHQSKSPKLMQAFMHNPFEGKECDTCHLPPKNGKVVLTQKNAKAVCLTCHEDVAKQIQSAKVKHPGADGDCTDCHNPHAGKSPGFLQPGPVAACLACHPDQGEELKKKHPHQPASEQGCATCHEPHGSDNAHLLRVKSVNSLCLECHGPDANPQKVEGANLVAIFDGRVKLPENYFRQVPILPLKNNLGHPSANHPVSDVLVPRTKSVFQMNCLSCHQSHAGNGSAMLVKDQENNMNFCKTCHANPVDLTDVRMGGK